MGADFKEKAKDTFKKCWDRASVDANSPDLLSRRIKGKTLCVEGDLRTDAGIKTDDRVVLRKKGANISAFKGNSEVAVICKPTADLLDTMTNACGIAEARVAVVDTMSGVGEFEIVK